MQQKRTQKKLRRLALALLVLTLVIALVGILVHGNHAKESKETQTFDSGTGPTEMSMLASFANWGEEETSEIAGESNTDAGSIDNTMERPATSADPASTDTTKNDSTSAGTTQNDSTSAGTTQNDSTSASTTQRNSAAGTTLHDFAAGQAYAYAYAGYTPQIADLDIKDWRLLLVNRNYMLPQDYTPPQGLAEAAKGTGVRLDARVAPEYQKMYDAAKADGYTLTPLSGHRRISTQKTNFDNKIQYFRNQGMDEKKATQEAAKIILPPGTSEHNAGLAMDIISLDVWFENTKEFKWLQEHAEDYGFVLRYPKNKENITQITYEPWHWRYVGVENARAMNARGQCLEEYVGAVR